MGFGRRTVADLPRIVRCTSLVCSAATRMGRRTPQARRVPTIGQACAPLDYGDREVPQSCSRSTLMITHGGHHVGSHGGPQLSDVARHGPLHRPGRRRRLRVEQDTPRRPSQPVAVAVCDRAVRGQDPAKGNVAGLRDVARLQRGGLCCPRRFRGSCTGSKPWKEYGLLSAIRPTGQHATVQHDPGYKEGIASSAERPTPSPILPCEPK